MQSNSAPARLAVSSFDSGRETIRVKRHRVFWRFCFFAGVLALLLLVGRILLPSLVRKYVNRTLDRNELYAGRIGPVEMHLWRGAYSIRDLTFSKRTGNVPVPLFAAEKVDFALQWNALLQRKIVGQILIFKPELNFVDASTESDAQTGAGGPWLQMIQDLFPFDINRAVVQNGSVHFRAYKTAKPVDVYLSELQGTLENLTNIRRETKPLIATITIEAIAMNQAKFEYRMSFDPFSYRPTFHLAMRMLGLDVTLLNDLALAYGKFDFKHGFFDLVVEADAKEGLITGYLKPLFRDLKVFSLREDLKQDNVIEFFWQALIGGITTIFKNHPRDQFGTLIPFTADISGSTTPDLFRTVINLLRNAFIRAYLPRLEKSVPESDGIIFQPGEISDPNSPLQTE